MSDISLADCEGRLADLLDQVARGEDVVIARDGEAVAKLVPAPAQTIVKTAAAEIRLPRARLAEQG